MATDETLDQGEAPEEKVIAEEEPVTWTASEFVAHEKTAGWYLALAAAVVALSAIAWLISKDIVTVIVIAFCLILLGIYAAHRPRELHYQLDYAGLTIETKFYAYTDFRSYAVVPEGALTGIEFMPMKRFLPPLTIYFDPADETKIINMLGSRLPLEPKRRDVVDSLMNRIRF